jgi:hypothetical protein
MRLVIKPLLLTLIVCLVSFSKAPADDLKNEGLALLAKSQSYHGIANIGALEGLEFNIQEPRVGNPDRYSVVQFGGKEVSFSLKRNRDEHISSHIIDASGNAHTLLNGSGDFSNELREKYRLDDEGTQLYAEAYSFRYGLPGTLNENSIERINSVNKTDEFDGRPAISVDLTLKVPVFASNWIVYFEPKTSKILGLDVIRGTPEQRGERIVFDQEVTVGNIRIPQFQHWYDIDTVEYLGSDVIVTVTKHE